MAPCQAAGSQCTRGVSRCCSTGNQRFGVSTQYARPTRATSRAKRRWLAASPTCSITELLKTTSKLPSRKGRDRPSPATQDAAAGEVVPGTRRVQQDEPRAHRDQLPALRRAADVQHLRFRR